MNAYDRKSARITRRSALGLGTGLLGAVLVAACSSAAPSTPSSTPSAASAPPSTAPKPAATPAANPPTAAPTTAKPAAAPTTAKPATAAPAAASNGKEKTAVILQGMVNHYGAKPYALWSGVTFWANAGQPSRILWAPIVDLDENLKIMPGLAESWEAVDNKTTKFHLRSGLKWSDGTPLTTKDIVFSFNMMFNKDSANNTALELATLLGASDVKSGKTNQLAAVKALDDSTFTLETSIPDSSILYTLATRWIGPIPEHIYSTVAPKDLRASFESPGAKVTSGPFTFSREETDKWYEFVANPSYWQGRPKLDRIIWVYGNIGDMVALAAQNRFQFSFANSPDVANALAKQPGYNIKWVDYIQPYRFEFNASLKQYSDPNFRKSVAYAIDRDTLTKQIYKGYATPQTTDFLGDLLDPKAEVYSFNMDKARTLLKQSSWNASDTVRLETGPLQANPDPIAEAELAAWQEWLKELGVKSAIYRYPDNNSANDAWQVKFTFQSHENPHRPYNIYGPLEMKNYLACKPTNYAVWCNEQVNSLLSQILAETDQAKYVQIARQMSVIVADQAPYIPTKATRWAIVTAKNFSGNSDVGEGYFLYMHPEKWDLTG